MQARTIFLTALVFLMLIGISSAMVTSDQNKGAPEIRLDAGGKGPVDFPHQRHQQTLGDCNICHNIFPQTLGIIKDLKDQGKLKEKQVMNHCRECHRSMADTGKKTGPTSCQKCHQK